MIEGIYSNIGINAKNRNSETKMVSAPIHSYSQYKEFSKAANDACIAYASPILNKSEIPQIPLDTLIKKLKAQGKKEGKDYIVEMAKNRNIRITINNKSGKPLHVIHYDNGDLNRWNCMENYKYKNGKLSEIISKRGNNKTFVRSAFYDNN